MTSQTVQPSLLQAVILAARPKTLPVSMAPVVAGSGIAFYTGFFSALPALAALLGALCLQIGANLANDVYDYQKGADTHERLGPLRVTQAGLLTPRQVLAGMWFFFGLAALLGVYLALHSGWLVVVIGLLSIAGAILYTAGPFPLGYNGLGESFVFLFFGLAAVCGTVYVQGGEIGPLAFWSAFPVGLLAASVLTVNNLRDIETDRVSGKHTLAVLFGRQATRRLFATEVGVAYLLPGILVLVGIAPVWVMLAWVSLPLTISLGRMVFSLTGRPLNQALAKTGQLV
ncbi:MAG: 1,4-dihydroxy-2-naphthoate polyprenyltransferase, partial [Anaerolineaceae bacterium]|nr:1,4-dihydroxy-2-naphthoate polyprenyltransferase [Anaerolineaceae bacterium]